MREGHLDIDGRRVGWTEHGDGEPVVFCNGAAMSGSFVFDAPGVRLICIDRAGLGRSGPDRAPDRPLADVDEVPGHGAAALDRPERHGPGCGHAHESSPLVQAFPGDIESAYVLPGDLTVIFAHCDEENAW